ncbi:MAG: purple acid phosphatase family protein [Thermoplasmatota archaeon]
MRGWMAGALLALLAAAPLAAAGPEQVHVSPTADSSGLVVQWASSIPLPPGEAVVQWAVEGGEWATMPAQLAGRTVGVADAPSVTYHYAATLGPFAAGTAVEYQAGTEDDLSLPLRTATPPAGPVRLVAYGDIGSDALGAEGAPPNLTAPQLVVQGQVQRWHPDLQLILGDLAYESTNGGWDRFMRFMEPTAAMVPTLSAVGNHEWLNDVDRYEQYLQRFVLPGDEQNYVATAGLLRIVVLNSDLVCLSKAPEGALPAQPPCPRGQPNPAALDLLRGLPEFEGWTIAAFHHPVWSSGTHGSDATVAALWQPLLEEAGVDLVLTAHDHLYERTHQLVGETVVDGDGSFERGAGTVYVVSGGGGRALYEFEPEQPVWSAVRSVSHHFLVIDATAEGLHVTAVAASGESIDEFTIGDVPLGDEEDTGIASRYPDISAVPALVLLGAVALAVAFRRRHL